MQIEEMKKRVFAVRPVLGEIYRNFGSLKLFEYILSRKYSPPIKNSEMFLGILEKIIAQIYGNETAKKARGQLEQKPIISTIGHHGIWGHPIFVNADTIFSLFFAQDELAISLSTESVSLNNTSSWSGSFLHHQEGILKRASVFPDRNKTLPVFSAPAITQKMWNNFIEKNSRILPKSISELHKENKLFSCDSFSVQASLFTNILWKNTFSSAPQLLYIPLETIINEYLIEVGILDGNILNKMFFRPEGWNIWKKYFFNEHTFLFWRINAKGKRESVSRKDLENTDIIKMLSERKLYASSPLCFVVLLLSGFTCFGGFTQTTWLTTTKEKFSGLLREMGEDGIALQIENIETKNFAESDLCFLEVFGSQVRPSAVDLLRTGKDYYGEFVKKAKQITIQESLDSALPTIYEVIIKK